MNTLKSTNHASNFGGPKRSRGAATFELWLQQWLRDEVQLPVGEISLETSLLELGVSSYQIALLIQRVHEEYGLEISASVPFEYNTIEKLSNYLSGAGT